MKFDPGAMQALLSLDDAALWQKIRVIAAGSGIVLSDAAPPHGELEKLREMMRGSGQADVGAAMQTIARYRRGGQG